jgi:hypothetical protein
MSPLMTAVAAGALLILVIVDKITIITLDQSAAVLTLAVVVIPATITKRYVTIPFVIVAPYTVIAMVTDGGMFIKAIVTKDFIIKVILFILRQFTITM